MVYKRSNEKEKKVPIFPTVLYVNGYGAAGTDDGNYNRYLSNVLDLVKSRPSYKFRVFLAGGLTNRTDLTEARAMLNWFEAKGKPDNAEFLMIEDTTTAKDNMVAFRKLVGDEPVAIFCEHSRRHTMRFFALSLFNQYKILPVKFDAKSLRTKHRLQQVLLKTPLEILAWYWKPADNLRLKFRARHVVKVRATERS